MILHCHKVDTVLRGPVNSDGFLYCVHYVFLLLGLCDGFCFIYFVTRRLLASAAGEANKLMGVRIKRECGVAKDALALVPP